MLDNLQLFFLRASVFLLRNTGENVAVGLTACASAAPPASSAAAADCCMAFSVCNFSTAAAAAAEAFLPFLETTLTVTKSRRLGALTGF